MATSNAFGMQKRSPARDVLGLGGVGAEGDAPVTAESPPMLAPLGVAD